MIQQILDDIWHRGMLTSQFLKYQGKLKQDLQGVEGVSKEKINLLAVQLSVLAFDLPKSEVTQNMYKAVLEPYLYSPKRIANQTLPVVLKGMEVKQEINVYQLNANTPSALVCEVVELPIIDEDGEFEDPYDIVCLVTPDRVNNFYAVYNGAGGHWQVSTKFQEQLNKPSIPNGTKCIFSINRFECSEKEWADGDLELQKQLETRRGQKCVLTFCTGIEGEKEHEYYNAEFEDGYILEAASGLHFLPLVKQLD